MKDSNSIYLILFMFIPSILFSQIFITQAEYTAIFSIGSTSTNFTDTLTESINIGEPGGRNIWDFTKLTAHEIQEVAYVSPGETPYADSFANANIASYIISIFDVGDSSSRKGELWGYYNKNDASDIGIVTRTSFADVGDTTVTETILHHYPAFVKYDFPLTSGKIWSVTDSSETNSYIDSSSLFSNINTTYYNIHIDAWGTMVMPSGKTLDALRIREQQISITDFLGIPLTDVTVTYCFVAKSGESLTLSAYSEDPPVFGEVAGGISWINYELTSVEKLVSIPEKFSLSQNYPNPFNPNTKIEYSITEPSLVKLKVYDILGNEIAELVDEIQTSGIYRYEFNGSKLSSGTYIVQLLAGDLIETRKMTLLK